VQNKIDILFNAKDNSLHNYVQQLNHLINARKNSFAATSKN